MTVVSTPKAEGLLAIELDGLIAANLTKRTQRITAEAVSVDHLDTIHAEWTDLVHRASAANVFMDPKLLQVAATIEPANSYTAIAAWNTVDDRRELVGLWTFAIGQARRSVLTTPVLNAPAFTHGYLATPVIDRRYLDETLGAMLDCIASDRYLPKIISLDTLAIDDACFQALQRVLGYRGMEPCMFERHTRPILTSGLDAKAYLEKAWSASSRKKLRQHRRRLSEKGHVESVVVRDPASVNRAIDEFLALEAVGWKGREGTALLCHRGDAAFMKGALRILVQAECASIHSIQVDQQPISMQIVVRSGDTAFTWKTAYDENYRDYSPGLLLLEDYTAEFLADKTIRMVDSCSFDSSGFMSAWIDRREVGDMWIDARRGGSLEFRILSRLQKSYRDIRAAAKSIYLHKVATFNKLQNTYFELRESTKAALPQWCQSRVK